MMKHSTQTGSVILPVDIFECCLKHGHVTHGI